MSPTLILLDRDAAHYAARLAEAVPSLRVIAGTEEAQVLSACAEAGAIAALAQAVSPAMVAAAPQLRWVQALTTGVDPLLDMPGLGREVLLTSARGIHGPQMAELAFFFMLNALRDVRRVLADQEARRWDRRPQRLLSGRTAVIVGAGAIGEDLARRCAAFGMRIVGVSARPSAPGFERILPRARLAEAAAEADFLIVIVPLSAETRHLVDAAVLAALPARAWLLNLARGPVVDEAAVADALARGVLAGAALDVFEVEPLPAASPLWARRDVLLTPHIGGMSESYVEQVMPLLAYNARAFAEGRLSDLRNLVERG